MFHLHPLLDLMFQHLDDVRMRVQHFCQSKSRATHPCLGRQAAASESVVGSLVQEQLDNPGLVSHDSQHQGREFFSLLDQLFRWFLLQKRK
jgi:hypothetical protein